VIYALDRVILSVFRGAAAVGLYEAAVRPHNLVRQLHSTLMLTVVPVAAGYIARGDEWRQRELVVRGTRYVMAVVVPVTVALMALSGPILEVWLGERFRPAAPAVTIFLSYWLLNAGTGVAAAMLVAAAQLRILTLFAWVGAAVNLVLALVLTPLFGLTGLVSATALQSLLVFPWFLAIMVRHLPVRIGELAREAWLPAYSTGAVLAVALVALQLVAPLSTLLGVLVAAGGSVALAWVAYYAVWLRPNERVLVRDFARRRAPG
jgi:O-antigen/teichoic acid export membrane protein